MKLFLIFVYWLVTSILTFWIGGSGEKDERRLRIILFYSAIIGWILLPLGAVIRFLNLLVLMIITMLHFKKKENSK